MEAQVAPKSTAMVFLVLSAFQALLFLGVAALPSWGMLLEYRFPSRAWPAFVFALVPVVSSLGFAFVISVVLAMLFARRLVKMREVRPEPNPRIWATLGGSVMLVFALHSFAWGAMPLLAWSMESAGFFSYGYASVMLDLATMSKGAGPAFLLIFAALLVVICFGMTRPRMAFLDEEHEVWGKETGEEDGSESGFRS